MGLPHSKARRARTRTWLRQGRPWVEGNAMKSLAMLTTGCLFALLALYAASSDGRSAARTPYAKWVHGPPADPNYFPIAVWLQDPKNAEKFHQAGINLYVALWQGPTEAQLAALKAAGMHVICGQTPVGLAHKDDPTIVGWMHGDEPDNAQPITDPKTGRRGWGSPVPPARIVADYERLRAADPTRP